MQQLKMKLNPSRPLELVIYSPSETTISFLNTILSGFYVFSTADASAIKEQIQERAVSKKPLDFIILDDQSEGVAERLVHEMEDVGGNLFGGTKVIHLYTPTISRIGQPVFPKSEHPRIFKLTKPPRKSRLLQVLAELKNLPNKLSVTSISDPSRIIGGVSTAQRTLYGNVLIAEGIPFIAPASPLPTVVLDNPIAQNLLMKQLERYDFKVTATSNGEEAIAGTSLDSSITFFPDVLPEWENHGPGYFSLALFDHRKPLWAIFIILRLIPA